MAYEMFKNLNKGTSSSKSKKTTDDDNDLFRRVSAYSANKSYSQSSNRYTKEDTQTVSSHVERPGVQVQKPVSQIRDYVTQKATDIMAPAAKELKNFVDNAKAEEQRRFNSYDEIPKAVDFAEKSKYVSTRKTDDEIEASKGPLSFLIPETNLLDFGDISYDYINKNEEARSKQFNVDSKGIAFLGLDNSERLEMTDEEISIFNYLYAKDTEAGDTLHKTAYKYIEDITSNLNYRQRKSEEEDWAKYANEHPVQSSAFSIVSSPLKGISYAGQAVDYLTDGKIDQNAGYNKFSYTNSAIRNEVNNIVEEKWGGVGSFAYQTGMSMGDFLFNAGITGGNQALALAIMGTGAAADTTISAKDRGLSDSQAFTLGTVAGAAEIVTEKISLDALFKANWEDGALRYVLKNMVSEGGEEVGSDIINLVADIMVSGGKSEYAQSVQAYMDAGYSEKDAKWKAIVDQAKTMGLDFLGGAISGGIMSGIGAGFNAYGNYATGKNFNRIGLDSSDVNSFVDEGLASQPFTQSYKLAQQAQQKLNNGGTLTNYELGRLYNANVRAINSENLLQQAAYEAANGGMTKDTTNAILDDSIAMRTLEQDTGMKNSRFKPDFMKTGAVVNAVGRLNTDTNASTNTDSTVSTQTAPEASVKPTEVNTADNRIQNIKSKLEESSMSPDIAESTAQSLVRILEGDTTVTNKDKDVLNVGKSAARNIFEKETGITLPSSNSSTRKAVSDYIAKTALSKQNKTQVNAATTKESLGVQASAQKASSAVNANSVLMTAAQNATTIASLGEHGKTAYQNYAGSMDSNPNFSNAFVRYYEAGKIGTPFEEVETSYSDGIDSSILYAAHSAGVNDSSSTNSVKVSTEKKSAQKAKKTPSKAKAEFKDIRTNKDSKKVSKADIDACKAMSKVLNAEIVLHDTIADNDGNSIANGYYQNGVIHLAADSDNPLMTVLKHEVTHYIQNVSPKKYQEYKDYVMKAFYENSPVVMDEQIQVRIDIAAENDIKLTRSEAMDEIVADATERFLTDRSAIDAVARENRSLAETILNAIRDVLRKIQKAMENISFKDYSSFMNEDQLKQAEKLWVEALADASQATVEFKVSDGQTVVETNGGDPVAVVQKDGSAVFSLKTYDEEGRDYLKTWLDKRVSIKQISRADADNIIDQMEEYYNICNQFISEYAPFGAWSNAKVVKDNKGKPAFSVIKANGEYAMNLDFSLVCKKRRTLDAVFDEMIKRGIMDDAGLSEAEISKINSIIRENGFETACALCFVDSKRYRQAKVADNFVDQYNGLVKMLLPEDGSVNAHYFDFIGTGNYKNEGSGLHSMSNADLKAGLDNLRQVMKENGSKTVPYKIAKHLLENPTDRKLVSRSEFMNTTGFEAVKVKNPSIMKLYNSSKGSGGPKAAFSDVQYLSDILKKNAWTPAKAYAVGGVRIQSFSDYIPRMVFDYIQMIGDLSAKNLPAHAYTKEAMFAKQFGMTGIKVNLSLVPAIAADGVAPGLDANGDYLWYDGQSFGSDVNVKGSGNTGFELAKQIQNAPGYSANCGTIAVGVSDQHIWKMLDDPDIRMIIPYHKSSLNHIVAVMNNIDKYTDYTDVQNTRYKDSGSKITTKDFNYNESLRRTGDAKAAASEYIAWCEKNGYLPKFDTFASHENYYKLLEDFATYDNGKAVPQGPVTMTFPKSGDAFGSMSDLIKEGLEEDAILEAKREKSIPGIVDQIESVLKKKDDGKQYSLKKSKYDYNTLISKPDMKLTDVDDTVVYSIDRNTRKNIVNQAMKNAASIGKTNENGGVSVYVNDIGEDILISKHGLQHGLDRRMQVNAPATLKAGEILKNSIQINELTPDKENISNTYVLLGAAKNSDGVLSVIEFVVNRYDNSLASIDVLYSVNTKKESAVLNAPAITVNPLRITDSTISISQLLDLASDNFPDILPESVLRHYGFDGRPDGRLGESALYQLKTPDYMTEYADQLRKQAKVVTDAEIMSQAVKDIAKTDAEKKAVADYQRAMKRLSEYEQELAVYEATQAEHGKGRSIYTDASGKVKKSGVKYSAAEKAEIQRKVDWWKNRLKEVEQKEAFKKVLKREKAKMAQNQAQKLLDLRNKYNQKLAEVRQNRDDKVEAEKQKMRDYKAGRKDATNRSRLLKIAKRLQNLKTTEANRALIDQYIGDLDTVAKSLTEWKAQDLRSLRDWYEDQVNNNPDFIPDSRTEDALKRLDKKHIKDLTIDEVRDLTDVLLHIENEIRTHKKMIDSKERRDIYQMGVDIIDDVNASNGSNPTGPKHVIDKYITTESLSPIRQIRRMTGYVDSDPMYKLANEMADGQRKMFDFQRRANERFLKWTQDKAFVESIAGKKSKEIRISGISNKGPVDVLITPAMRMSLYLHSKNSENMRHIAGGGVTIPDIKLYKDGKLQEAYSRGTTIKLTPSEVREITSHMSEKEKAFADAANDYFNGMSQEEINTVSEKLKGYSLAKVGQYFPINTDTSFTKKDFDSLKFDGTIEGMGFLKERINSASPIYLRDMNQVLLKSIDQTSRYVGLAIPVRNFNKAWGVTKASFSSDGSRNGYESSVQQAVRSKWGEDGYNYIENLMLDINGGRSNTSKWNKILGKIRSNYAGAVLTLNMSVAMKQAASYPSAAAVLGWKPLAKAMKDFGKVDMNVINKYTPLLWYRMQGFSTQELGDMAKQGKSLPKVLNWVQGMDVLTTKKLWKASEYYVKDNNPSLQRGTDEYYKAVAAIYNRVIEETQPNYTTMQRPQILRSQDTLLQNLVMFKTQPLQNFGILYDSAANYMAKKNEFNRSNSAENKAALETARKDLRNAYISQFVQLAVFAGMTFAWNLFRGKTKDYEDDETEEMTPESILKGIGKNMISGAAGMVPFGDDIYEFIMSKVTGDKYYGMEPISSQAISDSLTGISKLADTIFGVGKSVLDNEPVDWKSVSIDLDDCADSITKMFGIPYENITNVFNACVKQSAMRAKGKYVGEYISMQMTASKQNDTSEYADIIYRAYRAGDKESYDYMLKDMIASGVDEEKLMTKVYNKAKVSTYADARRLIDEGKYGESRAAIRKLSRDFDKTFSTVWKSFQKTME